MKCNIVKNGTEIPFKKMQIRDIFHRVTKQKGRERISLDYKTKKNYSYNNFITFITM